MKVIPIDSKSITPIDYSHLHDSKLLFTKYTESFDFGLTVNQYYFNQNPKDKKTNFNTQYTRLDFHTHIRFTFFSFFAFSSFNSIISSHSLLITDSD